MLRFGSMLILALPMFGQQVAWESMQETREHAFSVDVPKGWRSAGGIVHVPGTWEFRMWVQTTSPDGKITIRMGDPNLSAAYSIPDSLSAMGRVGEGGRLVNGMLVMRYEPGPTLAALYGRGRFSEVCANPRVLETKSLPPIHQVSLPGFHADAGQAILDCGSQGEPLGGYVFAETFYEPQMTPRNLKPMANWLVTGLGSFIAPKSQGAEAFQIFYHLFSSFRINPAWFNQFARAFNGAARGNFDKGMQQIQASMQRFEQQSAVQAKQVDDFNHVLMGQTLQHDGITGEIKEVAQGPWNNYWSNAKGQVVSSALSPGPGYTPMTPVH